MTVNTLQDLAHAHERALVHLILGVVDRRAESADARAVLAIDRGALRGYRRGDIARFLEILTEAGLLDGPPSRPRLTDKGHEYLSGRLYAPIDLIARAFTPLTPAELELAVLRRELADLEGSRAYNIFPLRTLKALASARPQSLDALRAIPGIGPTRAARYGPVLLDFFRAGRTPPPPAMSPGAPAPDAPPPPPPSPSRPSPAPAAVASS